MKKAIHIFLFPVLLLSTTLFVSAQNTSSNAPVIKEADGFVVIPNRC